MLPFVELSQIKSFDCHEDAIVLAVGQLLSNLAKTARADDACTSMALEPKRCFSEKGTGIIAYRKRSKSSLLLVDQRFELAAAQQRLS